MFTAHTLTQYTFAYSYGSGGTTLHHTATTMFRQSATRMIRRRRLLFSSVPVVPPLDHQQPQEVVPVAQPLIDFWTAAEIKGEESHAAIVTLRPGERLRAESGAMLFMTQGVEMETQLLFAGAAVARVLTGQNVFLTDFAYTRPDGTGLVGLGTEFPSKILRLSLDDYGGSLICQRGAFLASNPTVQIEMEFTKSLTAGFFGGQGFILQRLTGQGDVLIKGGGTIVHRELTEGEVLRVTSGSLVAFAPTVQYQVGMMPGIQNVMFGGEGLFVTTLTGPGQVWLQGMPPDRMIAEIARRVPGPGLGLPIPIGGGGGSASEGAEAASDEMAADEASSAVAATDAAVDADRQATVASSAMDADSPSALFGDAAPPVASETVAAAGNASAPDIVESTSSTDDSSWDESSSSSTLGNDTGFSEQTSFSTDEPTFQDTTFEDGFGGESQNSDLFDDTTMEGLGGGEETSEQGSSILGFLWDLFSGGGGDD